MSGRQHSDNGNRERRVYYSKKSRGGAFKKTNYRNRPFKAFSDGDTDMTSTGHSQRKHNNPRQRNTATTRFVKNLIQKKLIHSLGRKPKDHSHSHSWAKIVIPFGKKVDKGFILRGLSAVSEKPFVPVNFHYEGNSAIFYVEDLQTGLTLERFSRQLTAPDGFKMKILTSAIAMPVTNLDAELLEIIKVCMSNRYNASNGLLNLSNFRMDPDLRSNGCFVPLSRHQVFWAVVRIIEKHIPKLTALDLSGNKLSSLSPLAAIVKKVDITALNLENNSIRSVAELDKIECSSILELTLDKNPVCDSFKDKSVYISTIRHRFPKVIKLDGQDLPPPISFEIEKEIKLPSSEGNFFATEECKSIVLTFLDQYYSIYDSADRQGLLPAYSDNAIMSLSVNRPRSGPLFPYQRESRNLLKVHGSDYRKDLLQQGRLSVVSFLSKLPRTLHDRHSFVIDVTSVSPQMMTFSVCGLFKEFQKEGDMSQKVPIRSFCRTFIVVPLGSGISIINEMLVVCNATIDQIKSAFKGPAPTPSPSPVPGPSIASIPSSEPVDPKQQMAASFAEKSGMNLEFSAKCLVENDWDFDKAAHTFMELKKRGVIPPEAFQK